jgi:hypothetical protein
MRLVSGIVLNEPEVGRLAGISDSHHRCRSMIFAVSSTELLARVVIDGKADGGADRRHPDDGVASSAGPLNHAAKNVLTPSDCPPSCASSSQAGVDVKRAFSQPEFGERDRASYAHMSKLRACAQQFQGEDSLQVRRGRSSLGIGHRGLTSSRVLGPIGRASQVCP